jgi:hypothetical protein
MIDVVAAALEDPTDAGLARLAALHATAAGREAWKRLRDDLHRVDVAVDAIARSGALSAPLEPRPRVLVEDLLSMLGEGRAGRARATLKALPADRAAWGAATAQAIVEIARWLLARDAKGDPASGWSGR